MGVQGSKYTRITLVGQGKTSSTSVIRYTLTTAMLFTVRGFVKMLAYEVKFLFV